jgi:hypothetical protein
VVDCLLSMVRNSTGGTLIEAKRNDPGVVLFDGREKSTGDVVVLWLCPTVNLCELNEAAARGTSTTA